MRLAVLGGAGFIAQAVYLPVLRDIEDVEIDVCDVDVEVGAAVASQFGARFFTDADSLLAAEPDAVFVLTTAWTHSELALTAIEQGIPVFVEKPLSLSLRDATAIEEAVVRTDATVAVAYMRRHDSMFVRFSEIVASRARSDRLSLRIEVDAGDWGKGRLLPSVMVRSDSWVEIEAKHLPAWIERPRFMDFFVLGSKFVHELNLAATVAGPLEVSDVSDRASDSGRELSIACTGDEADVSLVLRDNTMGPWRTRLVAKIGATETCLDLGGALTLRRSALHLPGGNELVGDASIDAFTSAAHHFLGAAAERRRLPDVSEARRDVATAEAIAARWFAMVGVA